MYRCIWQRCQQGGEAVCARMEAKPVLKRQSQDLVVDGAPTRLSLTAVGEAEAIYRRADATAKGIGLVSQAVTAHGGSEAASLRVAEQYLSAFGQIAKAGNTLLLPAATNDPANMVAQALSIYKAVAAGHPSTGPRSPAMYPCKRGTSAGVLWYL